MKGDATMLTDAEKRAIAERATHWEAESAGVVLADGSLSL
jgi:hypothetical protein